MSNNFMKLISTIVATTILLLVFVSHSNATPIDVSTTTTTEKPQVFCAERGVCGWAVYPTPNGSRRTEYLANSCKCDESKHVCHYAYDDMSLKAFVYKCIPKSEVNPGKN